jgi:hypothetical protein
MSKYKIRGKQLHVLLKESDWVAKGGEGSIYIKDGMAYKICEEGLMIPDGKFLELALLDHPRIIKPEDVLLFGAKEKPVGYTMKAVPGKAIPLAQIVTKSYREREGINPDMMTELVKQIADGINYIHSKSGYLQVDGNHRNYMVTNGHKDIYFIDVNSYQTPKYPANAVMDLIRDWSVGTKFSHLSDWYAFAIVSWNMFTGIHPYKGVHPDFKDMSTAMVERMKAGVSILDQRSEFPKAAVYYPFDSFIPGGKNGAFMQWYKAVFLENQRLPAPKDFQAVIVAGKTSQGVVDSVAFQINRTWPYKESIVDHCEKNGKTVVVTSKSILAGNISIPKTGEKIRIGFANNTAVALIFDGQEAKLINLDTSTEMPFRNHATDIMSYDGRLFCLAGDYLCEIDFTPLGTTFICTTMVVANIIPMATRLYQGVAIQDMFGSRMVSIFPEPRRHQQFKMDELLGQEVLDAKFDNHVLMILTMNKLDGRYTRFVFRFDEEYSSYDVIKHENVVPTGLNFTVLPTGIAICVNEDGKVEVFSNRKGSNTLKVISDPAVKENANLCRAGLEARFYDGSLLCSFTMRKSK